jgi:hypothetical protein
MCVNEVETEYTPASKACQKNLPIEKTRPPGASNLRQNKIYRFKNNS